MAVIISLANVKRLLQKQVFIGLILLICINANLNRLLLAFRVGHTLFRINQQAKRYRRYGINVSVPAVDISLSHHTTVTSAEMQATAFDVAVDRRILHAPLAIYVIVLPLRVVLVQIVDINVLNPFDLHQCKLYSAVIIYCASCTLFRIKLSGGEKEKVRQTGLGGLVFLLLLRFLPQGQQVGLSHLYFYQFLLQQLGWLYEACRRVYLWCLVEVRWPFRHLALFCCCRGGHHGLAMQLLSGAARPVSALRRQPALLL
ncbi:hypothetical protein [Serratia rhizosphaerae]|uniref:hypothetical protein n=1 Tax=Serratia rhizosphaerae TaxID=2597702 RepID=UPI001BAE99D1|nr:hypothetical protein [Serratia rhizosphaerae]